MTIAVESLRSCSACRHWRNKPGLTVASNGYVEAICEQPFDERDHQWRRGSDHCGQWERRA